MKLRVLTFNTWGVPVFSRRRAARMRAIGRALAQLDVDVVGLQEVFYVKDRQVLAAAAAEAGLIYSHYFASGVMGSGLFTLSRYPIVETSFLRFRLNGRPQDLIRSDYYAGKGIGRVRVALPDGLVDVYNAHFIAPYLEFGPDRFTAHRVAQALEAVQYVRSESAATPAVLTCDLNCFPDDLTYQTIVASGGMTETHSAANPAADATTWTDRSGYATLHPPARFDYIFARSPQPGDLRVQNSTVVLGGAPQPNPDMLVGYSDHYGVLTEFELASAAGPAPESERMDGTVSAAIGRFLDAGIRNSRLHRRHARLAAAAAGATAAALLRGSAPKATGAGRHIVISLALAALLVTGGMNLSTAARLSSEANLLHMLMPADADRAGTDR